jgi:release factor glutamine methyltransferase
VTRIDALLRGASDRVDPADAALLLAHVLQRPRAWLYAHADEAPPPGAGERFEALLARRIAGEPVAYLTGRRGFWSFELRVTPDTLIPRPETERLVELALERLPVGQALRVADLGTGSGAIAIALALERPRARVVATDASEAALAVARDNAASLGAGNVEFRQGDWFGPLAGQRFALIASNPPYVAAGDPHLAEGDLRFEPARALASGGDGLDDLRAIAGGAPAHLEPGGCLLLEHGFEQGAAVRALLHEAGFTGVETACDLEARERVTIGQLGAPTMGAVPA